MSEEQLSEEIVSGVTEPEGSTEIPNGINIPVNNSNAQKVQETEEPVAEKILGKFDNQEALVKAYQELENKLGNSKVEETKPKETNVGKEESFNISKYSEEYNEHGALSESSYNELKEQGFPKEVVDAYVQGQAALGKQWITDVKALVGTDEEYSSLVTWASQGGVDETFREAYDEAVGSMDINKAKMAVEALKNLYNGSNKEPKLIDGSANKSVSSGDVYESWAQLTVDLNSKEYHNDPAERERVQQKLSRSKNL